MVVFTDPFDKLFNKTLKPWSRSRRQVRDFIIHTLFENPSIGDKYPGFGPDMDARKIRIGLDHYKIGKRNGLRLTYLYLPAKNKLIPLFIYKKASIKAEQRIKAETARMLKIILLEISGQG
jgi:hypothetical protein